MNFNLVEMYNGLLRFNKHILNELAEGLKHLPNLDGVSKGDSLIINEQGNPAWGSAAFIPTFENAAYGIEWTKDDNDIIRIGNAKFHRELPIQNRLKGCVYNEKKISYFLNPTGWAKPLENGFIPPLDGSDGDVGVRIPEFYMCVKDTGTKYQLWISDFNIDGTFTRVHPFIISHTKTMTRTREDGKEEVFSACIKPDDARYLGGNKNSSVNAIKLQGRPRTGINYDKANEFCANRGDWITMIDYLEYCANLYLSKLDHLCKEELKCKFYYRYADDIVILSDDKNFLHKVLIYIKLYVNTIGLKVKDNYQIYPVDSRGINFVGYVFYHTHTLIRKSIKYKIIRLVNSYLNREIDKKEFKVRMCAYYGWLKHANAKNLLYKIQSLTGVRYSNWNGKRTNIAKYYGKYVRIIQVINYAKYFRINFIRNGKAYYADSRDKTLFYSIHRLNHFPINFKITKYD